MSREQWGHGYWKGVEDHAAGRVKDSIDIKKTAEMCVLAMAKMQRSAWENRSLVKVSTFDTFAYRFCGIDTHTLDRVYEYILNNEPFGAYVSGAPNADKSDDYYVLPPNIDADKADEMLRSYE